MRFILEHKNFKSGLMYLMVILVTCGLVVRKYEIKFLLFQLLDVLSMAIIICSFPPVPFFLFAFVFFRFSPNFNWLSYRKLLKISLLFISLSQVFIIQFFCCFSVFSPIYFSFSLISISLIMWLLREKFSVSSVVSNLFPYVFALLIFQFWDVSPDRALLEKMPRIKSGMTVIEVKEIMQEYRPFMNKNSDGSLRLMVFKGKRYWVDVYFEDNHVKSVGGEMD